MKRTVKKILLPFKFALAKSTFLHPIMPDRFLMKLPLAWNFRMMARYLMPGGKAYPDIPCKFAIPKSFNPKVKVENPQFKMTEEEIEFFFRNGYTKPYTAIAPEEMAGIKDHIKNVMDSTSKIYPPGAYIYSGAQDKQKATEHEMANQALAERGINTRDRHLEDPIIMKLFSHPAIIERCAQLLGSDLLIWRSQFFEKQPNTMGTAYHQASCYLLDNLSVPTVKPKNINELFQLTVWISLTDSTIENGCMTVIPGTHHKIRLVKVKSFKVDKNDDQKRFGAKDIRIDYPTETANIQSMPMKAGQFFIFSERVIHGSHSNITNDQERLSINFRVISPETVVYNEHLFKHGNQFKLLNLRKIKLDNWNAVLVRGKDDFKYNRSKPTSELINI